MEMDKVSSRDHKEMQIQLIHCKKCRQELFKRTSHIHRISDVDDAMHFLRTYHGGYWLTKYRSRFGTQMCLMGLGCPLLVNHYFIKIIGIVITLDRL